MKKIAIIGSTGSIGRQTVKVCLDHPDMFRVTGLAAFASGDALGEQAALLSPERAVLVARDGEGAAAELCRGDADTVVVACPGFSGLGYTLEALKAGKSVALANKETLVCGGELVMPLAGKDGILPVDSEHSAIWQCLGFDRTRRFKNIYLTASGGAFRGRRWEDLASVTPEEALRHPTWRMSDKITVDCATLLNKGYEVMEAHHLYGAAYDDIKVLLHPQSVVHSMVEFEDGAVLAQLGYPSMELPITVALAYPERVACGAPRLELTRTLDLTFEPVREEDYPVYSLALRCARAGGTYPTVLNASSEAAVRAYLTGRIGYHGIYAVMDGVVSGHSPEKVVSYGQLREVDERARADAERKIGETA